MSNAFAFENFANKQVGTLKVISIVRRDDKGAPVYSVRCLTCSSTGQTVSQKELKSGAARCLASGCGKPPVEERRSGSVIGIAEGVRSADSASRRAFQQADTIAASRQEAWSRYCDYAYETWKRHGICITTFEEFRKERNL